MRPVTITHNGVELKGTYEQLCALIGKQNVDKHFDPTKYHWSETTKQHIHISDMTERYLVNVIMKLYEQEVMNFVTELKAAKINYKDFLTLLTRGPKQNDNVELVNLIHELYKRLFI